MEHREFGKLAVHISPEAMHAIISSGRLLELAGSVAREAAAQISAQLVEHVAAAALNPEALKSGATVNASFIFDGGDFGTVPPRPHWGVTPLDLGALRRVAAPEVEG
jgi:hypothetical protein